MLPKASFRSWFLLCSLLILVLTGIPLKALAQLIPEGILAGTDSVSVKLPTAIPASAVPLEAQKTLDFLSVLEKRTQPGNAELELPGFILGLQQEYEKIERIVLIDSLKSYDLRDLTELNRSLEVLKSKTRTIRERLQNPAMQMDGDYQRLKELEMKWDLTLTEEGALNDVVRERAIQMKSELSHAEKSVLQRSEELVRSLDELGNHSGKLDRLSLMVRGAIDNRQRNLFGVEAQPLLVELFRPSKEVSLRSEMHNTVQALAGDLKNFWKNFSTRLFYHLLFLMALISVLYYFRSNVRRWPESRRDEALEASLIVIDHPFAASLLISLLITPFLFAQAPEAPVRLLRLLSALPLIALVPKLFPRIPPVYTYLFAGLYILSELNDNLSRFYLVDRVFLISLDITAIVMLSVLLRPQAPFVGRMKELNWALPVIVLRMAVLGFGISVVANLLGNVVLAKFLSRGSLSVLFSGFFLYMGSVVIKSLLSLLLSAERSKQIHIVRLYHDELTLWLRRTIGTAAFLYWIFIALSSFMVLRPIVSALGAFLARQYKIGEMSLSVGNVLAFVLTLWISFFLAKIIRILLQDEILSRMELKRGVPAAISMLVRIAFIGFGVILAFGAAGIQLSNIAIIFGALTVGIGFGLQNIFNNMISGIIMAFERPVQVGDVVQVTSLNLMGEVKEIGLRSSHIQTFEGAVIVVPNGNLISSEVINWTLSDRNRRYEINVGVKYGSDLKQVLGILKETVEHNEAVLVNPGPMILFDGFGESSLNFRVLFWLSLDSGLRVRSEVGIAIDEALKKAGIEIPFPQRDVHVRSADVKAAGTAQHSSLPSPEDRPA